MNEAYRIDVDSYIETLPARKLTNDDITLVRDLVEYRENLKAELKELTNEKIGEKFGVHSNTIYRITVKGES